MDNNVFQVDNTTSTALCLSNKQSFFTNHFVLYYNRLCIKEEENVLESAIR